MRAARYVRVSTERQAQLGDDVSWDDKRALVKDLVAGIIIETRTAEGGERFPVAHATYRFERPAEEIPIPAELGTSVCRCQMAQY